MAEANPEQLKKIYQIFKLYQEATASPKPELSEEEERLRELERNNPYFSRYAYIGEAEITPELKEILDRLSEHLQIERICTSGNAGYGEYAQPATDWPGRTVTSSITQGYYHAISSDEERAEAI